MAECMWKKSMRCLKGSETPKVAALSIYFRCKKAKRLLRWFVWKILSNRCPSFYALERESSKRLTFRHIATTAKEDLLALTWMKATLSLKPVRQRAKIIFLSLLTMVKVSVFTKTNFGTKVVLPVACAEFAYVREIMWKVC